NKRDILNNLTNIQHNYNSAILSIQHFHLDSGHSLDVIAVKGEAKILTELSDKLKAVKGIQHGKLTMSRAD
ncbi:MAG: nickel-responsive transcriptional regulator NikR, partial [Ignavibacteria bacterium]